MAVSSFSLPYCTSSMRLSSGGPIHRSPCARWLKAEIPSAEYRLCDVRRQFSMNKSFSILSILPYPLYRYYHQVPSMALLKHMVCCSSKIPTVPPRFLEPVGYLQPEEHRKLVPAARSRTCVTTGMMAYSINLWLITGSGVWASYATSQD